jgi:hypothetical protein
MGRQHAHESIDQYHRDEKGRFAPMAHHDSEHEHAAGKNKREHRDEFHEGYHRGFHGKIKEHEFEEKRKAEEGHKKSSVVKEAIKVNPVTGEVEMDDPGRFHHMLTNGGSDKGYVAPSWLDKMQAEAPKGESWQARQPTESNPHRYDTDTLKNVANDPHLGLNLGMSEKAPFSRADVGLASGDLRRKENKGRAALRPGELASKPIQVTDYMGNTHTFVHQITAPNLNPHPDDPDNGSWVVSLHHHVSRPDGSAEWLPSEVTEHVGSGNAVKGRASDDLYRDIYGRLHANSDMVSMYGAGAQRIGDKDQYEYEFKHPSGEVVYRAKLANGYNKYDGYYYDPLMHEKDRERLPGGAQWNVTGRGLEREHPHDPQSRTRMSLIEGSDHPGIGQSIMFGKDDLPGVIQHVHDGFKGTGRPSWVSYPQHQLPNTEGKPPENMTRRGSVWKPEYNIHRSAERLPIW